MTLADDARRLNLRARRRIRRENGQCRTWKRLPAVILLTDEQRLADPTAAVAKLPRGSAVILRHYDNSPGERAALGHRLRRLTQRRGILLLIAGDIVSARSLAHIVQADGIHLPEWQLRHGAGPILRNRKPGWLITAAAHSFPALRLAARQGIDAVLLSPVFATASHPDARPLGILRFAVWARASRTPVYALGGVNNRSVARLRGTESWGIAAIGGLARNPTDCPTD